MFRSRLFLLAGILLAASICFADKSSDKASDKMLEDWLPVSAQDQQIKDAPGNPGAPAIRLYFSYFRDDDARTLSEYHRIKILTAKGLEPQKYADVEIQIEPGMSLKELSARTIHPDGSIVDFKGKPFEKTVIKRRGVKIAAETFTFPEVTVGSIVEYRYIATLPRHAIKLITQWPIQGDLYTVRERLRFRPFHGLVNVWSEWESVAPKTDISYAYLHQVDATVPRKYKDKGNLMELLLQDVPAFDAEEYMPPENDFKPVVFFYYGGREVASPEKYWAEVGKLFAEYLEKFIGNRNEVRELAVQTIGSETDPQSKLRKLYARVQQLRNLDAERERTEQEQKAENLKPNTNVGEVLSRGYGTALDIDCLFVALARAVGFESYVALVSDRSEFTFNRLILSLAQFDTSAALVKVNGTDVVLDPGTRFNPYGSLRWQNTSSTAWKFNKTGAEFITTTASETSSMHRVAKVSLAADGSLKGEITVELQGQDALEHRLNALKTDEPGRRKDFEDEVKAWMPAETIVKMQESRGWETSDGPLTARFTVEAPNFASIAGKRLVAPAFFFPTLQKGMFTHDGRRYPITFSYSFTEADEVTIKLPEGYTLEAPPYRRKAGLSYAGYEISSTLQDNQLTTKRALHFEGRSFPPEQYSELKGFFTIVQAGDGGQAVFRVQEAATAEKKDLK